MESSQKVNESIKILQYLSKAQEASSEAISQELALPVQTVNRTLTTLRKFNFVAKTVSKSWKLGIALLRIANTVPSPTLEASKSAVEDLAMRSGGAAILAISRFPYFTVLMERDGNQGPLRLESLASVGYPLHMAPPGIAILSHLDSDQKESILENVENRELVLDACNHVVKHGWAIFESFVIPGRHGICAPIFGPNEEILGSITIALPSSRAAELEGFAEMLTSATERISEKLKSNELPNLSGVRFK